MSYGGIDGDRRRRGSLECTLQVITQRDAHRDCRAMANTSDNATRQPRARFALDTRERLA